MNQCHNNNSELWVVFEKYFWEFILYCITRGRPIILEGENMLHKRGFREKNFIFRIDHITITMTQKFKISSICTCFTKMGAGYFAASSRLPLLQCHKYFALLGSSGCFAVCPRLPSSSILLPAGGSCPLLALFFFFFYHYIN